MRSPLLSYFALTVAATWLCWAGAHVLMQGADHGSALPAIASAVFLLGVFAPGLVALIVTERTEGRAATMALLDRIVRWQVDVRWYAFALAFMPLLKLSVALLHRLGTGVWPAFGAEAWYVMLAAIPLSTLVQAGEEVGWRGYALPRLAARVGLAPASLLLGVIWACWHLPLFFAFQGDTLGQSFPLYLVQVTALSVAMAWLYWRTQGSLLLVMLMHAAVNNTKDIVPSALPDATDPLAIQASPVAWLTLALLWIPATWFLVRMRRKGLVTA